MFIRTSRLFLRPAWSEDAPAVHAALSDWDIVRNLARVPWPYTMADAEQFCAGRPLSRGEAALLIWKRTDGVPSLVGGIGIHDTPLGPDLGYWIARPHWRRGYALEAAQAVLGLAFDGFRLPALNAGHFTDNPVSGKLLERLGFVPTGDVIPYACAARGCDLPSVEYLLTRDAWLRGSGFALAA